ncbi:Protein of unknown function [Granulicella pectinivorans]|jgi:hypothetical protein|uniref:Tat (Twin-arginine translocation) pathway signal sequence n=1 Tax=Granulicella pectinivorans TaxID=474950 RepID=A0A1I6MBI7_9BACT|nr:DUF1501 domain-containing protein [Granulicella pectinivorans]SFS13100.1 Protein of unknown function [Granulicella pectinivorans]
MKQHALCTDPEHGPTVMDLPIPEGLKAEWAALQTRRHFLGRAGKVLGWAGLASLMGDAALTPRVQAAGIPAADTLKLPHFAPKAKRAIYLFMSGAPPQMDLLDYKPGLAQMYDKDLPESVRGVQQLTGMTSGQARFPIAPSHWDFKQYGKSGAWVSDLLPNTAKMVDDLTIIRSTNTDAINHEPAIMLLNTGNMNAGKPCLGSWLSYGLGSMNDNLPAFMVLLSRTNPKENNQPVSSRLWSSGYLSSEHAGVGLRSAGDPVLFLSDPAGVNTEVRRKMLDAVGEMNHQAYQELGDPETNARIAQYEMAYRMQASVPELSDLSKEPQSTWDLYGQDAKVPGTFAYNCLMARRMAERGVRFTQIYKRGWDVHADVVGLLPVLCQETDRPAYALVTDLKQRGLLDDTLVIWGAEFGRTVYSQGGLSATNYGRDHHPRCYTTWMAGAGVRPGITYGETDEFSYNVVKDPVHVRDFNATLLHCMGIDHNKLTYKFQGLDQKLTGTTPANVIQGLLA